MKLLSFEEIGFYTELPDTSEKVDNGRGGVSCNNEENTLTSLN